MGYWLKQRLHTESKVTVGQTYRYKLPITGFYSAFSIRALVKRDATRTLPAKTAFLHEKITKIEMLMEGTKVVKSLRGRECLALNLYDFKQPNALQNSEEDGGYCMETFYLLAGRSLHDKKWMFDMSKHRDPEIAITNDVSSDASVDMDVDSLEYQIFGWRWMGDPVPSPVGYMRADERLYYDTTGAAVEKVAPISTGKRIRRLLLMGWEDAHTFYGHITKVELQVDEGAYSPVIIPNVVEWCQQNKIDYGLTIRTAAEFYNIAGGNMCDCDLCMCYPLVVHVAPYGAGKYTGLYIWDYDNGLADVVAATAGPYEVSAKGVGYLTSILLGFDKEPDLADMLETMGMASLKLLLTESADSDTVSLVVEEEVLY